MLVKNKAIRLMVFNMTDINIENLKLKFPETEQLLFSNINISVKKGEKVLLVGPSGSGKSTLLNVMGGLIPKVIHTPVKADYLDIPNASSYVFQDPDAQFTMPTVEEELAFILENQRIAPSLMNNMMTNALKRIGLDVPLDLSINQLSGGMKQKLSVAAALLQEPDTLFLDEPTSMLDDDSAKNLWETILSIWSDLTVVIVEHRVEYIWDKVDRVILMNDDGEIILDKDPKFVLSHHVDLLNEYGVWHPMSWNQAPQFVQSNKDGAPLLEIRDMKIDRRGIDILYIDHLHIRSRQWITLEGPNGAGKSSFLSALMKLIPHQGQIIYKNKLVKKTKDIIGDVYPVFQNPELQFITHRVYDEIYINMEHRYDENLAKQKTEDILKMFSLEHSAHLNPLELSTGQKRRLSVATALGGIPDLLLLDEPTFGLDQKNTFFMLELFDELVKAGTTIIMITHDVNIQTRYPSRRLEILDGMILEKDTHNVR